MFNAACTATYGSMCLKPSDTDCLALPLRHAVVRRGISNMTKHIENRRSFLRTTYAYDTKVGDAASSRGLDCETEEGSDDTYTPDVARAFLVLALQDITGPYSEGSAFCLPLLAEVTGLSFRWYHPGKCTEIPRCITYQEETNLFSRVWYVRCVHEFHPCTLAQTSIADQAYG